MKKICTLALILLLITPALFAATQAEFTAALDGFLTEVTTALPDSAVVGGSWSDAYIGQLIGIPPHFGIGVAAGVTRFPVSALKSAVTMTGMSLPVDTLFLPNAAIEARIGGLILPFDAGIRVAMIPSLTFNQVSFQYFNIGADVRYALLKEGLIKPDLSLGVGYTYSSGEIGYGFDAAKLAGISGSTYGNAPGKLATNFNTSVLEAKLQVSKNLVIITPYAGFGVYSALSKATYTVSADTGSTTGTKDATSIGARAFGGLSFNLLLFKADLSGMYNFVSQNWGVNLGARIQL